MIELYIFTRGSTNTKPQVFIHLAMFLPDSYAFPWHLALTENDDEGLPGGPVGKTLCSQGRGPRIHPWSGNWIPHATAKSLHATVKISKAATKTQHS